MSWNITNFRANPKPVSAINLPHSTLELDALVKSAIAGCACPLGALVGILLSPVSDHVAAGGMAFGAGALLFAVTVEIYGHMLTQLVHGHVEVWEMWITTGSAIVGALLYLSIDRWIDRACKISENAHNLIGKEEERLEAHGMPIMTPDLVGGVLAEPIPEDSPLERSAYSTPIPGSPGGRSTPSQATEVTPILPSVRRALQRSTLASGPRGRKKTLLKMMTASPEATHLRTIAFSLFLGFLIEGVPEGIFMGIQAAEGHLTPVLVLSILVANFPEAFASASLFERAQVSRWYTMNLWGGLCLVTIALTTLTCLIVHHALPKAATALHLPVGVVAWCSAVEGFTGGAMLACITSTMLPEAMSRTGKQVRLLSSSGFLCTMGFLGALVLKALWPTSLADTLH